VNIIYGDHKDNRIFVNPNGFLATQYGDVDGDTIVIVAKDTFVKAFGSDFTELERVDHKAVKDLVDKCKITFEFDDPKHIWAYNAIMADNARSIGYADMLIASAFEEAVKFRRKAHTGDDWAILSSMFTFFEQKLIESQKHHGVDALDFSAMRDELMRITHTRGKLTDGFKLFAGRTNAAKTMEQKFIPVNIPIWRGAAEALTDIHMRAENPDAMVRKANELLKHKFFKPWYKALRTTTNGKSYHDGVDDNGNSINPSPLAELMIMWREVSAAYRRGEDTTDMNKKLRERMAEVPEVMADNTTTDLEVERLYIWGMYAITLHIVGIAKRCNYFLYAGNTDTVRIAMTFIRNFTNGPDDPNIPPRFMNG